MINLLYTFRKNKNGIFAEFSNFYPLNHCFLCFQYFSKCKVIAFFVKFCKVVIYVKYLTFNNLNKFSLQLYKVYKKPEYIINYISIILFFFIYLYVRECKVVKL